MRVFTATLGTETNSFSPIPTGFAAFASTMLWRPGEHPNFPTEATGPLWICRRLAREEGWDVVEGTCAFAMPGGLTGRDTYETLRDEILGQLADALPVDLVALGLHGAMMAQGYASCEADLLDGVRDLVGPQVPVGALLDLHAHLPPSLLHAADVLIAFKEYPHTDFLDRSEELLRLLAGAARGEVRPAMRASVPPILFGRQTGDGAGAEMVQALRDAEAAGLLSASWIHGFPLGDSPHLGSAILAIADGDAAAAQSAAHALAARLVELCRAERPVAEPPPLGRQLAAALACDERPIILVDSADQPGAGGGGDNMEVTRELIGRGVEKAAVGPIWDPQSVGFCLEAGEGAPISLRIGGKTGPEAGEPLDVEGVVLGVAENATQRLGEAVVPAGTAAAVKVGGVSILLTSLRDQAYDPGLFETVRIDLASCDVIALKSSAQYRPGFAGLGGTSFPVRRGKTLTERSYRNRPRPLWPFEALAS